MLTRDRLMPLTIGVCAMMFLFLMLRFPQESLDSAMQGVQIWWHILLPALLPFLVLAEMLLGAGIVHFFGTLLDPLMRPVFRVPGHGGFVMAMGFASGYPVAAKLTSQLWEQKLITRKEGERLVSFCTTSDPIFMISAVSIGFFHQPSLALPLTIAHYGGAIILGILLGLTGKAEPSSHEPPARRRGIVKEAFTMMHRARLKDGRPFGQLLKDALESALGLILVIGGLVVFFSVIIAILTETGVLTHISGLLHTVFAWFSIPESLAKAVVDGFFEVTLGAQSAGAVGAVVPLSSKAAIAVFVLSWGGLSVHAQIASLLYQTPVRYAPFAFARLLHGILSAILLLILWPMMPVSP